MKKVSEEYYNKFENSVWIDFLTSASPQQIHQAIISSNWDGNDFLLNWIKNNENIDKATALITYWMSGPYWFKKYKDRNDALKNDIVNIEDFDFVEEMEQKYVSGFWKNNQLECDPKCDCNDCDWTKEYTDEKIVRTIPEVMFQKLEGKIVKYPEDFEEGLPIKFYKKIEHFLENHEIEYD